MALTIVGATNKPLRETLSIFHAIGDIAAIFLAIVLRFVTTSNFLYHLANLHFQQLIHQHFYRTQFSMGRCIDQRNLSNRVIEERYAVRYSNVTRHLTSLSTNFEYVSINRKSRILRVRTTKEARRSQKSPAYSRDYVDGRAIKGVERDIMQRRGRTFIEGEWTFRI